jgi:hypothetical protein
MEILTLLGLLRCKFIAFEGFWVWEDGWGFGCLVFVQNPQIVQFVVWVIEVGWVLDVWVLVRGS